MLNHILRIRLASCVLALPASGALLADCPCQQGGAVVADASYSDGYGAYSSGQFVPGDPYGYSTDQIITGDQYGSGVVEYGTTAGVVTGMPASTPGTPVTAPPGTLGQTYQLRSDPVPADRHPRSGMVVVHAPGATDVLVQDTNNFRTRDKLKGFEDQNHRGTWHFESIMLLPGQPNIHRVVAIYPAEAGSRVEVRYVRFIMGRMVYLDIE